MTRWRWCVGCTRHSPPATSRARACFTEDAVWHLPGRSPLAGDYIGFESIATDFLGRIRELTDGAFQVEVLDVFRNRGAVVVLQRTTGERKGRRLDILVCQLMGLRDGRIEDVRRFQSDQYALDEFWAG
jgi:uncharacterized protein